MKGWSLWVPLAHLLGPQSLLLGWEEVSLQSLLPSLGSKWDDLIWSLDRPWGMGRRDSRWMPCLSGGWHAAPVAPAGPPCRSALLGWAEWPMPEPGWQMGRQSGLWPEGGTVVARALWEKAGQAGAPVPPWSGCCPTEQRFWIPQFCSVALSGSVCPSASQAPRT